MQGFGMGRYRPPDADPTVTSFNGSRHPLGKRARHLSTEGVLIVRFELPFNIWCGHCNAHIAKGVRYNAHKKHVGDLDTIKIWSFGCKCHLCSAWFEIRTDPQNSRYIVHEGARQQNQDWDPEQHGGHPIYDSEASLLARTNASEATTSQSAATEKQAQRKRNLRLQELEALSDSRGSDPYTLNSSLRASFRKDKRARTAQLEKDVELRNRLGWHHDRQLLPPTSTPRTTERDSRTWTKQRLELQRPTLGSSRGQRPQSTATAGSSAVNNLKNSLVANTRARSDPFLQQVRRSLRSSDSTRADFRP